MQIHVTRATWRTRDDGGGVKLVSNRGGSRAAVATLAAVMHSEILSTPPSVAFTARYLFLKRLVWHACTQVKDVSLSRQSCWLDGTETHQHFCSLPCAGCFIICVWAMNFLQCTHNIYFGLASSRMVLRCVGYTVVKFIGTNFESVAKRLAQ